MKENALGFALASWDFEKSLRRARRRRNDEYSCLLSLAEILQVVRTNEFIYRGVYEVPVDRIIGSVNKAHAFDSDFNPTDASSRTRWQRLFAAVMDQEPMPPIDLYKVGSFYFVVDGHHRVSIARRVGMTHIDANVTEYVTHDLDHISTPHALYELVRRASRQSCQVA